MPTLLLFGQQRPITVPLFKSTVDFSPPLFTQTHTHTRGHENAKFSSVQEWITDTHILKIDPPPPLWLTHCVSVTCSYTVSGDSPRQGLGEGGGWSFGATNAIMLREMSPEQRRCDISLETLVFRLGGDQAVHQLPWTFFVGQYAYHYFLGRWSWLI